MKIEKNNYHRIMALYEDKLSLGNMCNGTTILENFLVVFLKIKSYTTIQPSKSTPGHFPQRNESLYSHRNKLMNIYEALCLVATT
jgi:hypothetical protein